MSIWEIQFQSFCQPYDVGYWTLQSDGNPFSVTWWESHHLQLPSKDPFKAASRFGSTCWLLAFIITVNSHSSFRFRIHLWKSHIVLILFVFCSAAWWIEGHNHSKVSFVLETCIDFSQFLESFDDLVNHWWKKSNLHTKKLFCWKFFWTEWFLDLPVNKQTDIPIVQTVALIQPENSSNPSKSNTDYIFIKI